MAEYKGIKGFKVQSLASDPTADEGQIWYNTTSNTLKYDTIAAGSWASGGNLNTGRYALAGSGLGTAGLVFAGIQQSAPIVASTESYDGSSWTEVADLSAGRFMLASAGTSTLGLAISGTSPGTGTTATEEWDATSTTTPPGAQNIKIITD